MILCKRVSKKIGRNTILSDITLRIEPGECVCIAGKAGSGKTTLMSLLIKADEPTGGSIEVDGVPLTKLPPLVLQLYYARLGIIFQEPRLLPSLTVAENAGLPMELHGMSDASVRRRVHAMLKRLNMGMRAGALPEDLSPGERALAGIARAFAGSPVIVLADEPFQLLDDEQAGAAMALFREAHAQGTTIVIVASDPAPMEILGARMLTLAGGTIIEKPTIKQEESKHSIAGHGIFETKEPDVPSKDHRELRRQFRAHSAAADKRKVRITPIGS